MTYAAPTYPAFPVLPGQGWSVKKTPMFSTRVASHVSGRESRAALYAHGLYQFELTFDGLADGSSYPGLMQKSLQMLMDIYVASQGQFGVFVYTDPTDNYVQGQALGLGDGSTLTFTAQRALIATTEPVSIVTSIAAVYIDEVPQGQGDWVLDPPNTVVFTYAPPAGTVVTMDFNYAYRCRFMDDSVEFENFMQGLWTVKSLKFRSVR